MPRAVVVSAHASDGKRAITKYAIAMSLRETKSIIYTSPFKALSNQMYRELSMVFDSVGLMTDDATLHPEARQMSGHDDRDPQGEALHWFNGV
jgi:ATP-dependent RNA helicase DOB1